VCVLYRAIDGNQCRNVYMSGLVCGKVELKDPALGFSSEPQEVYRSKFGEKPKRVVSCYAQDEKECKFMIRSLLHRNTRAAIGHAAACGCPACACFGPWCLVCTVTFLSEFSPLFRSVISEYCPPTIKKMAIIQWWTKTTS